jgi:hypothetical protein
MTLLIGTAVHAAPVDLAPKFKPETDVCYVTRSVIRHEVAVPETNATRQVTVRTESGLALRVTTVSDDGSAELQWRLCYFALQTDGEIPGIADVLDYDSRQGPSRSPLAPLFARLLEQPVTIRVDPAGRVVDFVGLPARAGGWTRLVDPLGSLADSFFSRETFEQLPLFVTAGAPRPTRVRTTWPLRTSVTLPLGVGSLVMDQQFQFKRVNARQKTAELRMTGTLTKGLSSGGASSLLGLEKAFVIESGAVGGQYIWDYEAGQLASAETRLDLVSRLDSPLGRMQLRQGMTSVVLRAPPEQVLGHRPPPASRPASQPAPR